MTIDNRDLIKLLKQATLPPSRFKRLKTQAIGWLLMSAAIGLGTLAMIVERLLHLLGFCAGTH